MLCRIFQAFELVTDLFFVGEALGNLLACDPDRDARRFQGNAPLRPVKTVTEDEPIIAEALAKLHHGM